MLHQQDAAQGHGEVYLPHAWLGSIQIPPRNGVDSARPVLRPLSASVPFLSRRNGGSISFLPGISPWTLVLASPVAIMLTPASSTSDQGGGAPCRSDEAHQRPYLSAFLRHPHPSAGWPGRSESLGRSRRLIFILSCLPNEWKSRAQYSWSA